MNEGPLFRPSSLFRVENLRRQEVKKPADTFILALIVSFVQLMDRISALPDNMIDLVLERLKYMSDRVRTSALSRSWRSKWTRVSSLPLDMHFHETMERYHRGGCLQLEHANIINCIMLQHCGRIREFSLYLPNEEKDPLKISLFHHSISVAAKSTSLETLLLDAGDVDAYIQPPLPSSVFSSESLRRLEICVFNFHPPPWFKGFPNLVIFQLSLNEQGASPSVDTISRFISVCPLLEEVELDSMRWTNQGPLKVNAQNLWSLSVIGFVSDVDVSNAPKLGKFEIKCQCSHDIEEVVEVDDDAVMFRHFGSLAHIQELALIGKYTFKLVERSSVIHTLPRFDHLKSLRFIWSSKGSHFEEYELRCVLRVLAASPNVKEFILVAWSTTFGAKALSNPTCFAWMVEDYINDDFRNLTCIRLHNVLATKTYMKLIEQLLRFSPVLEFMDIRFDKLVTKDARIWFLTNMVKFYRTSGKVRFEIN